MSAWFWYTPDFHGATPEINAVRDGTQMEAAVQARAKVTPLFAKRSMFGTTMLPV
ncbi:MAG: hypothetical protein HC901_03200 [Bdellovibrionaceae bacterium]|nr:hypothetical protein [Pseudobdellovibrionaceae bacterium]